MDVQAQLDVMRWTVIGGPAPRVRPGDVASLAGLFKDHRLVGRALRRVEERVPEWATRALLEDLATEQRRIRAELEEQRGALRRFDERYLAPSGNVAVLLKGYNCHFATGSEAALRATRDIDLIAAAGPDLVEALRLGGEEEYRKHLSPHELVNARVHGLYLDVHGYHPVWSTTPGAGRRIGRAEGGVACFDHLGQLHVSHLGFEELLEGAVEIPRLGTPRLRRPDAAASALVQITHGFRDVMSRSSVSVRCKPPLRFAELAEVRDYLALAELDRPRLEALVRRHRAEASVAWMGDLLRAIFDDDRLSAGAEVARPVLLSVWGGVWSEHRYGPEHTFGRHLATRDVVAVLGGGEVQLPRVGSLQIGYRRAAGPIGLAPPAAIHGHHDRDAYSDVTCAIARDDRRWRFELEATCADGATNHRMFLDLDGFAVECNWNVERDHATWKHSDQPIACEVEWRRTGAGHRATIVLARSPSEPARVPLLFGAGAFERDHVMRAGTVIPVNLR